MRAFSSENKHVLIASCSVDHLTWEPVAQDLTKQGYDVTVFEADKVALRNVPFELTVNDTGGMEVRYDSRQLCLDGISAAWFRRPSFITNPRQDGAAQMSLDGERRLLQSGMWDSIPDDTWLNSPSRILRAERKLTQLRVAQRLGFNVPDTVVTNDWTAIQEKLPQEVICKSNYSIFYDGKQYRQLYTTPFANDGHGLPIHLNPYPGIWQQALGKAREWRITVVGDDTFDAAIYTADDAKDDWRKHQLLPGAVEFRSEKFSDDLKLKCFNYLGAMGLRFGAFDFIENEEGAVTFLECNPNGQYMWIERQLGLPISKAMTSEIVAIATK